MLHPYVLLFLLSLGPLAILPLFPSFSALRKAEAAVVHFANRGALPIVTLFFFVIGVRLALLAQLGLGTELLGDRLC